jgi:hypothetical protein
MLEIQDVRFLCPDQQDLALQKELNVYVICMN